MIWQESILVALAIANTVAAAVCALVILRRRPSPGARTLAVAVFTLTGWSLAEMAAWVSTSPEAKMLCTKASLLPAVTVPAAMLAFALRFDQPPRRVTRLQAGLLTLVPAITVLLGWTNDRHNLLWRTVAADETILLSGLRLTHGPWFWFHSLYGYALLLAAAVVLVRHVQRSSGLLRRQGLGLLLAGLTSWVGHLLGRALPGAGALWVTAGITATNGLLLWNLFGLRLFDILPLARAAIMDQMEDCFIVLDRDNRIVDLNAGAERAMGLEASKVLGQPPQSIFRDYAQHLERWRHQGELRVELPWEQDGKQQWFDMHITPLHDLDGSMAGNLVTLHDITARKELEAENMQRRLFLENLLDATPDAIVALDNENRILEWSGGAQRLFGYTAAEAQGKDLDDLVSRSHEAAYAEARGFTAQVVAGIPVPPTEVRRYRKDGTPVEAILAGAPIHVGDELLGIVGVYTDLAPLRQAEEAVRQSEERFRAVIQGQTELITRFLPDGTLTFANDATCRFLGKEREELLGTSFTSFIPESDAQAVTEQLASLSARQPSITVENRVFTLDRETRWLQWANRGIFDDAGVLVEVQSVGRDITENKLAQDALRDAETRYRTLVETSPDSIALLSLDGKILFCNRQTALLHGYSEPAQMNGACIPDLFAPHDLELAWETLRRALARDSVHNVACTMKRLNGSHFAADLSVSVVRDAELRPTGYIAVCRDVTSHQRAEEQLQASLREKDMLLSEIHHRVKSNLQIVSSLLYLQALEAPDGQTAHILEDSRRRVHSMALVHERLYGSADLTRIDMRPYIDDLTGSLLQGQEERSSSIELVTEVEDVTMPVDVAIPCGMLINELVANALQHAFPKGKGGRIELVCRAENGGCVLEVNDDGAGMPAAVDGDAPSTLGMQLVNMLVEQLQGSLEVETGNGTRVHIQFASGSVRADEPGPDPDGASKG